MMKTIMTMIVFCELKNPIQTNDDDNDNDCDDDFYLWTKDSWTELMMVMIMTMIVMMPVSFELKNHRQN